MSNKKYTIIFLVFFSLSLSMIGTLNYLVNPFDIFSMKKISGFNERKPESNQRQRLSKTYIIEKSCHENLIMGNSRALAISSDYNAWPNSKAYNYAITNASMYEMFRYFQHALASCKIRTVILNLDFIMFEKTAGHAEQFIENRLKVTAKGNSTNWRVKAYLTDSIPALFSLTAFNASINTINNQNNEQKTKFKCSAPQHDHFKIAAKGGHHPYMIETNRRVIKEFTQNHTLTDYQLALRHYENFIKMAYKNNIQLILSITPSHASFYELLQLTKFKNHFNNWLKNIISINEKTAISFNKPAFNVYNFSGYNSFTTERIPAINNIETGMSWFWESLHFKKELSYHMLDRIFDHERADCPTPSDFGVKINSINLASYTKQQIKHRQKYLKSHPDIIRQTHDWK